MKVISYLFLLLIFSGFSFAQEFWDIQISNINRQLNSVHFADKDNGWTVGSNGTILHTNDGGSNWQIQESNTVNNLNAVFAISTEVCLAVGDSGTALKTLDGGTNWLNLSVQTDFTLRSVYFLSESIGSICGGGWQEGGAPQWAGKIIYTNDGGNTWTFKVSTHYCFFDIQFLNEEDGYSVGFDVADPIFYFTHDGGANWDSRYIPTLIFPPYSMQFLDIDNGFITWETGSPQVPSSIVSTSDRGVHWEIKSSFEYAIKSLYFFDINNGYICGDYGSIYYTNNSGTEWTRQEISSLEDLKDIFFINDSTGWVIGANGTILKTTQGIPTDIKNDDQDIPIDYVLYQNYPNPFNPTTRINYSVPKQGSVSIKIYDALGRDVTTLVNEEKPIGNYTVEYNAIHLSSGIYFYQIKADEFIQTKKMILLR